MPVFRVKKVKDYTIMPNLHLRNRQLSLRAKGLDAITTVIHELEQAGYITRARVRNEKGQLREMEYTVYSSPKLNDNYSENPVMEKPTPDNPTLDIPTLGKPTQ